MVTSVFVSSQSGALGRGTGGPAWSGIDNRVRVWGNANPLGANGTAFRTPVNARAIYGTFENTDCNNAGVWFCHRLAQYTDDNVDMTIVARGGTTISGWAPGNPIGMLQECLDVWAASGQGPSDIFVWHGNESNATTPVNTYRDAWLELAGNLQTGGVIGPDTLVILVGTPEDNADRVTFNRITLPGIVSADSRCVIAKSDGLQTFDGLHLTGDALYTLGAHRILDAYVEGISPMVDMWALVNEGGTPGVPGSGENKIANLESLLTAGYRLKGAPIYMTSNQTYTRPSDVVALRVRVQGGGGGGAGALGTDSVARVGAGGGGGGYCEAMILTPASSYSVTVGAGGSGGAAGQNNGTVGSSSSFGSLSASGGGSGTTFGSSAELVIATGGTGTGSTSGDYNSSGQGGERGVKLSAAARIAGHGGGSALGAGGRGFNASAATTSPNDGGAGTGYGSGGGGGCGSNSANAAGGNGAPGVVIVEEYVRG